MSAHGWRQRGGEGRGEVGCRDGRGLVNEIEEIEETEKTEREKEAKPR